MLEVILEAVFAFVFYVVFWGIGYGIALVISGGRWKPSDETAILVGCAPFALLLAVIAIVFWLV